MMVTGDHCPVQAASFPGYKLVIAPWNLYPICKCLWPRPLLQISPLTMAAPTIPTPSTSVPTLASILPVNPVLRPASRTF